MSRSRRFGSRQGEQRSGRRSERREARPSELVGGSLIMGRNCLRETLRKCPERVLKVFHSNSSGGDPEIADLVVSHGITSEKLSSDELTNMVNSGSHQSYVALVKEKQHQELKDFIKSKEASQSSSVLMLDSINDPQNFGSILRAAECFGVDAVIWSRNRGASLTPVVSKASVGASELVNTIPVANLNEALKRLKDAGYWVVAADASPDACEMSKFEFPQRFVLVLGSEGEGLHRILLENCDYKVMIPMQGQIDSLNVSQATSVFLWEARRQLVVGQHP